MPELNPYQTVLEKHPEVLRLIGALSVEATNLDVALAKLLSAVLHIDHQYGRVVYLTPKSAYARLEILENSIKEATRKQSPIQKELLSYTKRARTLIGKRHEAMHFAWGVSRNEEAKVTVSNLPFSSDRGVETKELGDLKRTISDLRVLINEVWEKAEAMFEEWPPYTWPKELVE